MVSSGTSAVGSGTNLTPSGWVANSAIVVASGPTLGTMQQAVRTAPPLMSKLRNSPDGMGFSRVMYTVRPSIRTWVSSSRYTCVEAMILGRAKTQESGTAKIGALNVKRMAADNGGSSCLTGDPAVASCTTGTIVPTEVVYVKSSPIGKAKLCLFCWPKTIPPGTASASVHPKLNCCRAVPKTTDTTGPSMVMLSLVNSTSFKGLHPRRDSRMSPACTASDQISVTTPAARPRLDPRLGYTSKIAGLATSGIPASAVKDHAAPATAESSRQSSKAPVPNTTVWLR
mmetsp:Transcript_73891/g.196873  ORF Transcript_73891/g.196873 Transcript_73891/m.196873 type:complete len:285 (-) Transcript_73891:1633-2487(-)